MIEKSLYSFMEAQLTTGLNISWGKVDKTIDWETGVTSVNFWKLPSQSARVTPSYLDSFQISVRNQYIDEAQSTANEIITLFHLFFGKIGDYRITIDEIFTNGVLYEDEDIVHIPLTMRVKYTQL